MTRAPKVDATIPTMIDPLDPLREQTEKVLLRHPEGRRVASTETVPTKEDAVQKPRTTIAPRSKRGRRLLSRFF